MIGHKNAAPRAQTRGVSLLRSLGSLDSAVRKTLQGRRREDLFFFVSWSNIRLRQTVLSGISCWWASPAVVGPCCRLYHARPLRRLHGHKENLSSPGSNKPSSVWRRVTSLQKRNVVFQGGGYWRIEIISLTTKTMMMLSYYKKHEISTAHTTQPTPRIIIHVTCDWLKCRYLKQKWQKKKRRHAGWSTWWWVQTSSGSRSCEEIKMWCIHWWLYSV